jgi:hypothetical protein
LAVFACFARNAGSESRKQKRPNRRHMDREKQELATNPSAEPESLMNSRLFCQMIYQLPRSARQP